MRNPSKTCRVKSKDATLISHLDPDQKLCVHTDASNKHWSIRAIQCDPNVLSKLLLEQQHKPPASLRGTFPNVRNTGQLMNSRRILWSEVSVSCTIYFHATQPLVYLPTIVTSYSPSTRLQWNLHLVFTRC